MSDGWTEPGRWVRPSDGAIDYAWPPQGRFADLWARVDAIVPDADKGDLLALLNRWEEANSTLVATEDADGNWVDVEPHWDQVHEWLKGND